jgi:TPP-dependent pyruvate/acetoin dehydrogenase alpha subunit
METVKDTVKNYRRVAGANSWRRKKASIQKKLEAANEEAAEALEAELERAAAAFDEEIDKAESQLPPAAKGVDRGPYLNNQRPPKRQLNNWQVWEGAADVGEALRAQKC